MLNIVAHELGVIINNVFTLGDTKNPLNQNPLDSKMTK